MFGLSTTALGDGHLEDWLEGVSSAGFDFVEWISEWPRYINRRSANVLAEEIRSFGLELSIHAPFSDLNIGSFNERIRTASMEVLRETLEIAADIDAMTVTIHPGHCSPVSRRYRERYTKIHRSSLRTLDAWHEEFGVKLGVENMPSFPILDAQTPERLSELLEGTDLGVTFDVGHLNTTTAEFKRFLELLGDRVIHIHLHDNHGESDEHLALGEGTVPWKRLFSMLPHVPATLEVAGIREGKKSLNFLKTVHRWTF
ncbi:sugar phosphate isomerase/epimerase [Thermococcus sp.]|uniref:sugar phosphate isomerase/epimerase family protein n=1 Tax=Thermococcus sp. TaxID=35749 RepID=UPI0025FAC525|nr:sugar phosphate isomerase/epimerase family protein [Thermococcus sp.]